MLKLENLNPQNGWVAWCKPLYCNFTAGPGGPIGPIVPFIPGGPGGPYGGDEKTHK